MIPIFFIPNGRGALFYLIFFEIHDFANMRNRPYNCSAPKAVLLLYRAMIKYIFFLSRLVSPGKSQFVHLSKSEPEMCSLLLYHFPPRLFYYTISLCSHHSHKCLLCENSRHKPVTSLRLLFHFPGSGGRVL